MTGQRSPGEHHEIPETRVTKGRLQAKAAAGRDGKNSLGSWAVVTAGEWSEPPSSSRIAVLGANAERI